MFIVSPFFHVSLLLLNLSLLIQVPAELQWGSMTRAQTDRSSTLWSSLTLHLLPGSPGKGNRDTGYSCRLFRPLHTHTPTHGCFCFLGLCLMRARRKERSTAGLSFTLGHKRPVICLWALNSIHKNLKPVLKRLLQIKFYIKKILLLYESILTLALKSMLYFHFIYLFTYIFLAF